MLHRKFALPLLVILLGLIFGVGSVPNHRTIVYAQSGDTGYLSPTTFANDDGNWANGQNAFSDDNSFAASTFVNDKAGRWYDYPLSIPNDATITGIEVRVDASGAVGNGWLEIEVTNGTQWSSTLGTHKTVPPRPFPLPTTKQTYIVGGAGDLWGLTWTASAANTIQVKVRVVSLNEEHHLWWLPVRIYYTTPEPTATNTDTPTSTATGTEMPTSTATPTMTASATSTIVPSFTPTATATATSTLGSKPAVMYFALGDSVASGHGLLSQGTCRTSPGGYPYEVKRRLEATYTVQFTLFACSGASAVQNLRGQVDQVIPRIKNLSAPVLVSVTIGANDFGWTASAFYLRLAYATNGQYNNYLVNTADDVKVTVEAELRRLLAANPHVVIVLTDYFNPSNPGTPVVCNLALARNCSERIDRMFTTLNKALSDVQQKLNIDGRVQLASIYAKFKGHEAPDPMCSGRFRLSTTSTTWIQYPGRVTYNSFQYLPELLKVLYRPFYSSGGDCFHPNDEGAVQIGMSVSSVSQPLLIAIMVPSRPNISPTEIAPTFMPRNK